MADIRLHHIVELTPELMADLAAGGYRAVRDPELVIYVADQQPVRAPAQPDGPPSGDGDANAAADPPEGAGR